MSYLINFTFTFIKVKSLKNYILQYTIIYYVLSCIIRNKIYVKYIFFGYRFTCLCSQGNTDPIIIFEIYKFLLKQNKLLNLKKCIVNFVNKKTFIIIKIGLKIKIYLFMNCF